MPFINEKVSQNDIEKYGLREVNKKYLKGDFSYEWTIDRDRDIYLREMGNCWQSPRCHKVGFYWKGHLMEFIFIRTGGGVRGEEGHTAWALEEHRRLLPLPKLLEVFREEIVEDLKSALRTYKDDGIGSTVQVHTATFLF